MNEDLGFEDAPCEPRFGFRDESMIWSPADLVDRADEIEAQEAE